jgi:hypothetical protein
MCVPVNEHSSEKSLVVELGDKEGGFSQRDYELASSFSRAVASLYSCSVMASKKAQGFRRGSMLSKILFNIDPIKHVKVEQFITQQRRISAMDKYIGSFLNYNFSVKTLSEHEMNGGIVHIFNDLNFVSLFKIRKTTLIRLDGRR